MNLRLGSLIFLSGYLALQTQVCLAADAYLKPPDPPTYEVCKEVDVQTESGSYKQMDQACVARNAELKRNYNAQVESYNRSTRMLNSEATVATKPVEPTYENCQTTQTGEGYYQDYACLSRNQQKRHDYSIQSDAWNKMQQEQAIKTQQQEQQAYQAKSAADALKYAQEQNNKASSTANKWAGVYGVVSAGFGVAFAVSCSGAGATCNYSYLASSMAFGMMSAQSSKQANRNDMSAYEACLTQAQISAKSSSSCTQNQTTMPNPLSAMTSTFDKNGNCIAADKTVCDETIKKLPKGTNMKDLMSKVSSFASNPPYKINPDGSITTKDGKTFKPGDFNSLASLMAAGMTEEQAKAALDAIKKNGMNGKLSDIASKDLKSDSSDLSGMSISGSGTEVIKVGGSGGGGSLNSEGVSGSGRKPAAAEGLTRDFNGELIGAAGDDIFGMMNRRYKTKTAQDSFFSN